MENKEKKCKRKELKNYYFKLIELNQETSNNIYLESSL